ncbi:ATP-binding cassette domain-containing protein [Thiocystis violascens]|uniref:ATPase component of Mn/Zn ABC-type transporter n=1 Tax=Thiocystis violascens (strain ATCC 17096 / DSM 198 / 6111) TaxID=765911 RepID=I3YBT7_THIV6|nr:ATP-binding cassette domain-containing protein [Thiocystis violascens]AFL74455.1 ATPase component of Mn/Zn ABC-type transporter [Thiocystis violascens DSM 198]
MTLARGEILLRVSGLTAGYARPVIGPLSFEVRAGEVLGLWGRNGTGKSTILKAIGHAARVFAGRIEAAPGLTLAYLEQQPTRFPRMPVTGHELLRSARAARTDAPLALAAILHRRLDRLSGGQYQLLWVWSALATAADLVLLDEPTNNLDPDAEARLVDLIVRPGDGRAVLLVSHERRFLESACSRIVAVSADRESGCSS